MPALYPGTQQGRLHRGGKAGKSIAQVQQGGEGQPPEGERWERQGPFPSGAYKAPALFFQTTVVTHVF